MQPDQADGIALYSLQSGATNNQIRDVLYVHTCHIMQSGCTEMFYK